MDYLVQAPTPTVNDFCEQHFVSKSTLLRKSAGLKRFMAQYSLRFSYTDLQITGNESHIRYFLFIVYWTGFHGIKWPWQNFSAADIERIFTTANPQPTAPIFKLQQLLLLGIMRLRINHGYYIRDATCFNILTDHNSAFDELVFPTELFGNLATKNRHNEAKFFFFAQFSLITAVTGSQTQAQLVLTHFAAEDDPIWRLTVNFLAKLTATFHTKITPADEPILTYDVLRVLLTTIALQTRYPKMLDFYRPDLTNFKSTQLYQIIAQFFEQPGLTETLPQLYRNRQTVSEYVCYLLQPQLHHLEDQQMVHVWLIAENNDLLTTELQRLLKHIRIAQLMTPPARPQDADLIISTIDSQAPLMQEMAAYGVPLLHWNLEANGSDFFRLYAKIKTLYAAKMTTK
ncbi:helix-turn-helix domain-containing protein [Loigolactobacillus jiayinensis]|uniref:Helix-turn-helix domain-containing protein n=1 Tax=Loigolactobacillus jiayinensis TaxID=2486016 RepID=A0ABW1RG42_9LACO